MNSGEPRIEGAVAPAPGHCVQVGTIQHLQSNLNEIKESNKDIGSRIMLLQTAIAKDLVDRTKAEEGLRSADKMLLLHVRQARRQIKTNMKELTAVKDDIGTIKDGVAKLVLQQEYNNNTYATFQNDLKSLKAAKVMMYIFLMAIGFGSVGLLYFLNMVQNAVDIRDKLLNIDTELQAVQHGQRQLKNQIIEIDN